MAGKFVVEGQSRLQNNPLLSCRFASSHLPQGDGFSGSGKVFFQKKKRLKHSLLNFRKLSEFRYRRFYFSELGISPKWEPLAVHANFISLPRPLPLGEVDLRSKDGEGEDADLVQQFL